ncbi:MAG: cellulase family glycosylhydrolase [Planctomycetota bacterium]
MRSQPRACAFALAALLSCSFTGACATAQPEAEAVEPDALKPAALPALTPKGRMLVDPQGEPVTLRGVNLGAWLLLEPWMWAIHDERVPDQHTILTTFRERFGPERAEELLDLYRANWITPRDLENVRSFGFNLVRVPFHYHLIEAPGQPFQLRDDAFEWLDRAVEMADDAGLYVILDLHGAPGGQSTDMPSGRVGENNLWTDPVAQRRTIWVWEQVSKRYAGRANVVAYDLLNEPWGDIGAWQDVRPVLLDLVGRLHDAIRAQGDDTLLLAAGTLRGIDFYGDPKDRGWTHVGFTEHAYPGLFNQGEPSLYTHAAYAARTYAEWEHLFGGYDVPFLLGEFNPVWDRTGGPHIVRAIYDICVRNHWMATMWSYKLMHPNGGIEADGWYLVANAEPFRFPDLFEGSDAEWERAFRSLSGMPLAVDEGLQQALRPENPAKLTMPTLPATPDFQPAGDAALPGYVTTDIGGAQPGGLETTGDRVTLYAGGQDIFADHDRFRFVHRPEPAGAYTVTTRIDRFQAPGRYAKAGLMLRQSEAPDAAHVLLHVFGDGQVMLAHRAEPGGATEERRVATASFPIELGLARRGDRIVAAVRWGAHPWREIRVEAPPERSDARLGLAVSANQERGLARLVLAEPPAVNESRFRAWPEPKPSESPALAPSLVDLNGTDAPPRHAWGDAAVINDPHDAQGPAWATMLAKPGYSGVWQDVAGVTQPGRLYRLTIDVEALGVGRNAQPEGWVEVRLEDEFEGEQVALGATRMDIADLVNAGGAGGGNGGAATLTVLAPALSENVRVLVMFDAEGSRGFRSLRWSDPRLNAVED